MQQLRRNKQITVFKTWTEPDLRQMQATTLLSEFSDSEWSNRRTL
jgi:hypothetical protein